MPVPSVLFVPVSGPRGMGEYARALAIATEVRLRWPAVGIHFALSRAAPYSGGTPFDKTLLPASPTFHTAEMLALMADLQPRIVLFDNAGRSAQIRAAWRGGSSVIFVSSRPRQRRRAFRIRWMRMLEEHWIAYPRFVAGELTWLERTKLRIAGRPTLRFLDTLLPSTDATFEESTLRKYGVTDLQFVLIVPGGGSDHKGALRAPDIVLDAARRLAAAGNRTLLVGAANGENDEDIPLTRLPRIPFADVVALMRRALVVVSNGGDTLLQSIACQRPTVAFPIAGDQALRIERCVRAGLAEGTELHSQSIERATLDMLADGARLRALETRLRSAGISNGMETVMDAVGNVLGMT